MLEKLHIYVSVIAALIVTVAGIAANMTLAEIGLRLIIAVPVIFVLGWIAKNYLARRIFAPKAKEPPEPETVEEEEP